VANFRYLVLYLPVAQQLKLSVSCLVDEVSRSHTITHTHTHTYIHTHTQLHIHTHTQYRIYLQEWSAHCRGRYLHSTQRIQELNVCAFSGIRTGYPNSQSASDLLLRPYGHRDRQILYTNFTILYCDKKKST